MIKRYYIKKIVVSLIAIFSLFLIYLIPNQETIKLTEEIEYVDKEIKTSNIFLLDSNNRLGKTKIVTTKSKDVELAKELINALIIDSNMQDKIPNGFKAIIPSNTKIKSVSLDNNIIKIEFNDYLLNTKRELQEKIVESIVYTLTEIDSIDKVIIFIDGKILDKVNGKAIPTTLDRSFGINKEYDIASKDNISKTTIYYVSKFNDYTYYVPVTKINNDDSSKIEIIINELSSSNTYTPTLMSYLNSNTEIVSTSIDKDTLNVEFNDYIFNDVVDQTILEEVIYTICLSIEDNYDVNNVVFSVNNKEIYKTVLKTLE